jgi:ABC-type transporter Mla subunit MlaD
MKVIVAPRRTRAAPPAKPPGPPAPRRSGGDLRASRSLIVGVVIALLVVGGAAFAVASGHFGTASPHEMKITFPSADGLVGGSDVLLAGAKIGTVSDIQPLQSGCPAEQTECAQVTVSIEDSHWPLHQGLRADIRPKSLLGEKYVDLHDGTLSATYDTNRVLAADKTAVPVELDQLINSLDPPTRAAVRVLLDDLGAGVAGQGMNLNQAIATGKADLAHLAIFGQTLDNRDADLDRILVGLDNALSAITTNDQLTQWSQLISNGQSFLNDIESVQTQFSRSFTDANVALADLNTALGGAIPSLRTTLNVAPSLVSNLQQEASMLAALGATVTTSANLSPNGECTSATTANQPITSVTGAAQCSPLWMTIKGLLSGPTAAAGARASFIDPQGLTQMVPIFRICIEGVSQFAPGSCNNSNAGQNATVGLQDREGAMLTAMLGT